MGFGLRVFQHARRTRPASLPVRLPAVGILPQASFSHDLAVAALPFGYDYFHQFRSVRFI
jgi:hypothetical protein